MAAREGGDAKRGSVHDLSAALKVGSPGAFFAHRLGYGEEVERRLLVLLELLGVLRGVLRVFQARKLPLDLAATCRRASRISAAAL